MKMTRRIALTLALALGALSAGALPAAAGAEPDAAHVWISHGIPGATVEVCVDGGAVRNVFNYGRAFRLDLEDGRHVIQARARSGGDCTGALIARASVVMSESKSVSILFTLEAGAPTSMKWVNFREGFVGPPNPILIRLTHAAKAPRADVWAAAINEYPTAGPIAIGIARGESTPPLPGDGGIYILAALASATGNPIIPPQVATFNSNRSYQVIIVGTKADNYRTIIYSDGFVFP